MNNFFSDDASAFNCELTAFEKLDMDWVPTVRFLWQQQHHAGALVQEANTRPELKPLVVKVWADFQLTIVDRAHTNGENDSRHVSRLSDSILNSCCILYLRLLFVVCIDSEFSICYNVMHVDHMWCDAE